MAKQKRLTSHDIPWGNKAKMKRLVGRKIETYFGPSTLVELKNGGFAFQVQLCCSHMGCNKSRKSFLRPGCAGPDHYVCDARGKFVADLRDQVYTCKKHRRET